MIKDNTIGFFGRGSAFADEHNSAFFSDGKDLVLIDCSVTALGKLKKLLAEGEWEHIYVLVTHMHSDHIGGIPLLVHYAFYVMHLPVTVAMPSRELSEQMGYYLGSIEGCDPKSYEICPARSLKWVKTVIPTKHTPTLQGRCFGYQLTIGGGNVVYTGDTATLEPFAPYIDGSTLLYTEIAAIDSGVHLYIGSALEQLKKLSDSGTQVYLMHIDNEQDVCKAIEATKISLAHLY